MVQSHYQEIIIKRRSDVSKAIKTMAGAYRLIHICIAVSGQGKYAVSFPNYPIKKKYNVSKLPLGDKIRVFGTAEDLKQLDLYNCLKSFLGEIILFSIEEVPKNIKGYAIYSRERGSRKTTNSIVKRYAKRHNISIDVSYRRHTEFKSKKFFAPYLKLRSSTGNMFECHITKKRVKTKYENGKYNSYGLSSKNTVPEF